MVCTSMEPLLLSVLTMKPCDSGMGSASRYKGPAISRLVASLIWRWPLVEVVMSSTSDMVNLKLDTFGIVISLDMR